MIETLIKSTKRTPEELLTLFEIPDCEFEQESPSTLAQVGLVATNGQLEMRPYADPAGWLKT